jgi:hypothetical protein
MRPTLLVIPLAAVLVGACGGSGTPSASDGDTNEERALKFTRCMREHGIDMPDPVTKANGERTFRVNASGGPGRGNGPDPARMEAADKACRKYAPNGGKPPSAAEQQEMRDRALAFSKCMRDHGVDFPDPKFSGNGGVTIGGPRATFNPDSPSFKAGEKACQSLMGMPGGAKGAVAVGGGPKVETGP